MEVELRQGAFDHVGGHLLRHLEVAGAHGDVIEADDAGQAAAVDHGQAPHPMADHQRRRLVELHRRLAADQGPRSMLADGGIGIGTLGKYPQGKIAVGDHGDGGAAGVHDDHRTNAVISHLPGHRDRACVGLGGDDAGGHDFADLHAAYATTVSNPERSPIGERQEQTAAEPERIPVVPLMAGVGPENPPCPACGEPLFGWIDERPGLGGPVSRCESCGLGVIGGPGDAEEALRELDSLAQGEALRIANRAGFSAWVGGAGWAGLEQDARYLFTVEAVRRLIANRDQVVSRARWAPGMGIAMMWQTILNGFTFGRNVALGALGRAAASVAERPWQRRLDALISVVVAVPVLFVALPLELLAAAFRRGGAASLEWELL